MKSNELLRNAVRMALASGVAAALAAPAAVAQEEDDEEARELDRVEVTGSRIKRTDLEGAVPVTTIDRDDIEMSGFSNAADLIRNLPFNSAGSFRPQSGSSAQSLATVSLRGIGSDRTLVLVNGRRMPKSPLTGQSNDLNMIPMGAIERIEILSDGASAIYGSDAIGGVVNVILRDDYEGAEIMVGGAEIEHEGGDRTEGHAVFGTSGPSGKLIAGISWNTRDIVFARNFPWYEPGGSIYSNNYTTLTGGFDNFNWADLPGACEELNADTEGEPWYTIATPSAAEGGERCAYNFALVSADEASIENESAFVRAEHWINNDWSVFMDVNVNKTDSFGRYAPVPDSSFFAQPVSASSPNNPTNPTGYFAGNTVLTPQPVNVWHRFDALGNRDNTINTEVADALLGTSGMIGMAEVEVGYRRTTNKVYDVGRNYLHRQTAYGFIEDGTYNLTDPYGADPAVLNAMRVTISRISRYDQNEAWANVGFDAGALPAGPISWFFGTEYRSVDYNDQYDSLSEAGQVGGSAGNSAGATRTAAAAFFETLMPLTNSLELNFAGRYDSYSDYGTDVSPKISLRWDATDDLVVRGSYGQGFRAPTLDILSQQTAFSADSVVDPQTCINRGLGADCGGSTIQINAYRIANPELESENSDQFSAGVAWAPTDFFNGSLDYYDIEIEERINFFSSQELINRDIAGQPQPPGLGVTRSPSGSITRIDTGYSNEGTLNTSGIDLKLRFNQNLVGGQFSSELMLSRVMDYTVDGGRDQAGDPGLPEERAVLANQFAIADFSFGYNINMIGSQADNLVQDPVTGDTVREGHVPTWVTHDVQFNYFTPWDSQVTLGVRNAGGKQPPVGQGNIGSRAYDFNLYNGYGRITYLRFTQSF